VGAIAVKCFGFYFSYVFLCIYFYAAQAALETLNPPAAASRVLGLQACTTTPGFLTFFTAKKFT
jgi:hypothetical protein